MNIRTLDLNLLPVLDALLSERHVTRAAERLHLSQPAVSNALARLRDQLGDPLLVRGAGGLLLTPRAAALADPVRALLAEAENLLRPPDLDPAQLTLTLRIAMPDYVQFVLLPRLVQRLADQAPGIRLGIQSMGTAQSEAALHRGELDLVFGYLDEMSDSATLYRQNLFRERFVCLARRNHPRVHDQLNLDQFCAESHILVSPQGGGFVGVVDQALAALGRERRVVLSIPLFLIAPRLVMESDLLITLAQRVADVFAAEMPLQILPPPFELPQFAVSQAWHARTHHEPAFRWLRAEIAALTEQIDDLR